MPCRLCALYEKREIYTTFYYEDEDWIIVECDQCKVPMIVYKRHEGHPPQEVRDAALRKIASVMAEYGIPGWFDDRMRSIKDHYHAHWRPL